MKRSEWTDRVNAAREDAKATEIESLELTPEEQEVLDGLPDWVIQIRDKYLDMYRSESNYDARELAMNKGLVLFFTSENIKSLDEMYEIGLKRGESILGKEKDT